MDSRRPSRPPVPSSTVKSQRKPRPTQALKKIKLSAPQASTQRSPWPPAWGAAAPPVPPHSDWVLLAQAAGGGAGPETGWTLGRAQACISRDRGGPVWWTAASSGLLGSGCSDIQGQIHSGLRGRLGGGRGAVPPSCWHRRPPAPASVHAELLQGLVPAAGTLGWLWAPAHRSKWTISWTLDESFMDKQQQRQDKRAKRGRWSHAG